MRTWMLNAVLMVMVAASAAPCEDPPCEVASTAYLECQNQCANGVIGSMCAEGTAATCLAIRIDPESCQVMCTKCICVPAVDVPQGPGL